MIRRLVASNSMGFKIEKSQSFMGSKIRIITSSFMGSNIRSTIFLIVGIFFLLFFKEDFFSAKGFGSTLKVYVYRTDE